MNTKCCFAFTFIMMSFSLGCILGSCNPKTTRILFLGGMVALIIGVIKCLYEPHVSTDQAYDRPNEPTDEEERQSSAYNDVDLEHRLTVLNTP